MSKKQINEKELLAEAKAWFEQKYKKSPKDCNVEFIKIWHKPTAFRKTTAVVFAPTEKVGKAFMWEQNVIFRTMKYFWIVGIFWMIFTLALIYALQQNKETAREIVYLFTALCGSAALIFLFLAKKCKKLEKIHSWNVEVYYPQQ